VVRVSLLLLLLLLFLFFLLLMHIEQALLVKDHHGRNCRRSAFSMPMPTVDHFDRLPDSLLLLIFNKLADIKALGRCCAVSRRFYALAPLVDNVVVKVDCVISGEESGLNVRGGGSGGGRGIFSHLFRYVVGTIVKPLQVLQQFLGPKKTILAEVSHHSPGEVLKNFKEIQSLRIELPGGELGIEEGVLLKWKAEFGSTLESCVILGAASLVKLDKERKENKPDGGAAGRPWFLSGRGEEMLSPPPPPAVGDDEEESEAPTSSPLAPPQDDSGSIPESFYTDGGLKLRVVWTISSLIAASARHYLLQQIISDHPTLESLVLTDADGQGMLCMSRDQLHEFREKPLAASATSNRTQVPALNMKLWYAPYLELPGGTGLKGATLVAIRPSDHPARKEAEGFVAGAFEEPFRSAANLLVKRRTYLLEMNSF
jgi:hypothetical protein